jgi:N-acetyl-gamma-glutamyl-phosphate reductase
MIRVAIVGGTGYTGVELLRLLARHPEVAILAVTSRSEAGRRVDEYFPSLRGVVDLCYSDPDPALLADADLVFYATPNGTAMQQVPGLLASGVRVVDLSADFRLRDVAEWQRWYGQEHAAPGLLEEAVYGLPEVYRETIQNARLVANPGCYPTAVQLGFLPLLENDVVDTRGLVADAKSGVSGAGRKSSLATQLCEVGDSFKAYAVSGHRHLPEILQGLRTATGRSVELTFVPHLVPMLRGIHATLYARLKDTEVDLQELFENRYRDEPFVDVMPPGSHPDTRSVRGANTCRLAWHRPGGGDVVVVLCVEDNLVKGAAGQAVQNMNIMFGFDERAGLTPVALVP